MNIDIRWMIVQDMDEVIEIERFSYEFPWSREYLRKLMCQTNTIGMVCTLEEQIVGFMVYEVSESQLNILNIAVHPGFARCGIGTAMVDMLKHKIAIQKKHRLLIKIRETNFSAQMFFKQMGFIAVVVLQDFYDNTDDDAYIFRYDLEETSYQPVNRLSKIG